MAGYFAPLPKGVDGDLRLPAYEKIPALMKKTNPNSDPPTINHFIGQKRVKSRVSLALEASWIMHGALPHMLMTGPAGVGKSTLAALIAREMGTSLIRTMGQALSTPGLTAGFLCHVEEEKAVVFIDEIHEMPTKSQTALFTVMTDRQLCIGATSTPERSFIQLPRFTLLAATTDDHRLLKPLRERFEMDLHFERYTDAEIADQLGQRVRSWDHTCEPDALEVIAAASLGIPRKAVTILKTASKVRVVRDDTSLAAGHVRHATELMGLDTLGLNHEQQQYLLQLMDISPQRLIDLAYALDSPAGRVQRIVEPDLFYLGLVRRSTEGRLLTRPGINHAQALEGLEVALA